MRKAIAALAACLMLCLCGCAQTAEGNSADDSGALETSEPLTRQQAVVYLKKALPEYLERYVSSVDEEYIDDYLDVSTVYQDKGEEKVYFANWIVYRITGGSAVILNDGRVVFDTDAEYPQYNDLFPFDIEDMFSEESTGLFINDPTFESDE